MLTRKKSHTRAKTRRPEGSKSGCLRWDSSVGMKTAREERKGGKSEETGLNQCSKNMITLRRAWGDEWKQRPLGRGGETELANREKEENSIPEKPTNITGKQLLFHYLLTLVLFQTCVSFCYAKEDTLKSVLVTCIVLQNIVFFMFHGWKKLESHTGLEH